jgi:2,4-dienoyl-CoA reductase-like NADH-dependent reductase (Old Yellow Enzyme family)
MHIHQMLFTSFQLRDVKLRNRIVVSPMCQYSSEDGFASDWHLVHLGSFATGGSALVLTEATAVLPEGRITPNDLGIWKDEHLPALERITRFVKQWGGGAVAGMQLAHAGRKASTARPWEGGRTIKPDQGGWIPEAPSPIPFNPEDPPPKALDEAGIARVIRAFVDGTVRALAAGFEVLELHAAHGYLLHSFLSPLSNHRDDRYGGSFDNRVRLLREVSQAVRAKMPERLPLVVRISCTDWVEGGWDLEQSIALSKLLLQDGVELIDCSSGGLARAAKVPFGPGYQTRFAEQIRRQAKIKTGAVGLIRAPDQAEHILRSEQADVVILARELLRNPRWPLKAARALNEPGPWPPQYERARD